MTHCGFRLTYMISLASTQLRSYLESQYKIVGMVDIDSLVQQPRKTLYQLFSNWYKPCFEHNERIVLYSRTPLDQDTLIHIQKCASLVDISNFFILLCSPTVDQDQLESVRKLHSCDDCVFSTLEINITDALSIEKKSCLTLPDSFCFSPWAHLEITSQGEFRPCCVYKGSITDHHNRPYNINTDTIETVYHSDYLKNLRAQFVEGKKPMGCSHCWYREQYNAKSNRQWTESNLGLSAQTLHIEQDTIDNLISLDIKLGNLCNFKCRICMPAASSKVAEERARHFETPIDLRTVNKNGQWVENTEIWHTLQRLGNQLVNIDFYGGEPFLIKQHEMFLDYLIGHNYSTKIKLHYNSNGSVYPANLIDKWKQFKHVNIHFSIDNIGQRFEFERGGCWEDVEANLDRLLETKLPNMSLGIFVTLNVQNVYYIEQLIDWYETKQFDSFNFSLLEEPSFLSVKAMNQELVNVIVNRLKQIPTEKINRYGIESFIQKLENKTVSPESIDQLKQYMLKLDTIRNQNFALTHPEIASIIYKGN